MTSQRVRVARASLLAAAALLAATAGCARRIPLPEHLEVAGVPELKERMQRASVAVDSYTAEARLTYFGPDGRVRGSAILAVKRPASFRYELMGPHGGVIEAFATNGRELQLLDLKSSRFVYGPARAQNIDRLLPLVPLSLGPREWVGLLFGDVPVPDTAALAYDDRTGVFVLTWEEKGEQRRVEVDPESARVVAAAVLRGEELVSEVRVLERNEVGLPVELRLRAPAAATDAEIRLRDIATDVELADDVFTLEPPRGFATEHLDDAPPRRDGVTGP